MLNAAPITRGTTIDAHRGTLAVRFIRRGCSTNPSITTIPAYSKKT